MAYDGMWDLRLPRTPEELRAEADRIEERRRQEEEEDQALYERLASLAGATIVRVDIDADYVLRVQLKDGRVLWVHPDDCLSVHVETPDGVG